MKTAALILAALIFLIPAAGSGQVNREFVPYLSSGYTYQFVNKSASLVGTFYLYKGETGKGWTTGGPAAFGTLNNTTSPPCPLNTSSFVKTTWASGKDLLIKKYLALPAGTRNLKIAVRLDNAVRLYVNQKEVTNGIWSHNICATGSATDAGVSDTVFIVPDNYLHTGTGSATDTLSIYGVSLSSKNFLDARVTGDVANTITLTGDKNLSFSPSSPVFAIPGNDVTINMILTSGYHVATLLIDNQPVYTPTATYTFKNVTANHTLTATSLPNNTVVGTTADGGSGSLRDAILSANSVSGTDNITFTLPGGSVIKPLNTLPIITDGAILDGTSEPGYVATPLLTIDGSQAPAGTSGITINANGVTIKGMTIAYFKGSGILINGNSNTIGGTNPKDGNIIRNNGGDGVTLPKGTAALPPVGNAILSNSIYSNAGLGIDLGGDGITQNVYGTPSNKLTRPDPPTAANSGVNFPLLSYASISSAASVVEGTILSWPATLFRVQVYLTDGSTDSQGEGKTFLGEATVTTDGVGSGPFSIPLTTGLAVGQYVTATATEMVDATTPKNTSEFAANQPVGVKTKYYDNSNSTDGHFVVNLTYSGIPLHWRDGLVSYRLSNTITDQTLKAVIPNSFATWSTVTPVHFTQYIDPVGATVSPAQDAAWGGNPDGFNNVVWIDGVTTGKWTDVTPAPSNVIAITRLRYNAITGEITDADIAINNDKTNSDPLMQGFDFEVVAGFGR